MLNGIKNLVNSKIALQEAAELVLGESTSTGMDLDDMIVIGEDGDEEENPVNEEMSEENDDEPESTDDENNNDDEENDDIGTAEGEDDDPEIPGTDDAGATDPSVNQDQPNAEDDFMDADIDGELPTPIGRQTGEPVEGNADDFMNVEVDLRSNTLSNVLPIPPANAGEAIASDDLPKQNVDSGFGGNESTLTEAISLAGGMEGKTAATDETGDPAPTDDSTDGDTPPDNTGSEPQENTVTTAVRDKVNESEASGEISGGSGNIPPEKRDDLLKKLGNITKNLEDAKKAVMDAIS